MLKTIRNLTLGLALLPTVAIASLDPTLFHYDDAETCTGLHVTMRGELKDGTPWVTRSVTEGDFGLLCDLYQDPDMMTDFGDGSIRTNEQINQRITLWSGRSRDGYPHAGQVLVTADEEQKPLGVAVAGAQGTAGWSEIAYLVLPQEQGKGAAGTVLREIVHTWAPQVRNVGLKAESELLKSKFSCFNNAPLELLYLTSSPTNIPSWKIQLKVGFLPQATAEDLEVIDMTACGAEDYKALDAAVKLRFEGEGALEKGKVYPMLDQNGEERSISMHAQYGRLKYHFTYTVPNL